MTAALQLSSITHRYPGSAQPALDAVNLEAAEGEMIAVLGPSGSGKTTLLRVAAGLEFPESGDVRLDGASVLDVPTHRRDVTMMFQKPHLFPHLSVLDNVAFSDRLRGLSRRDGRAVAQRYLELVHLPDLGYRRPRHLSGGQEQRVALARALAASRRVMLLDEPFSALDTGLRRSMHDLLGEVRAALDPTIVIVTHDLDEAGLADRVAVLVDGRIEQFDTIQTLYTEPRTLAIARLVGGFNEVPGHIHSGVHRSALGAVDLPAATEQMAGEGTAVLLVRKERLQLVDAARGSAVPGRVVVVHQSGPRQDVVVELSTDSTGPSTRVEVEAPLGVTCRPGDRTGVMLPAPDGVWAVAGDQAGRPTAPEGTFANMAVLANEKPDADGGGKALGPPVGSLNSEPRMPGEERR